MAAQMRIGFLVVLALGALGVLATGCGGGDGSTAQGGTAVSAGGNGDGAAGSGGDEPSADAKRVTGSSLSKAAFIKQGNEICRREGLRVLSYRPPKDKEMDEGEVVRESIKVAIVPAFRATVDEIYALGAPSGEVALIQAFLDSFTQAIDTIEARRESIGSYKPIEKALQRPSRLARKASLEQCVYVE